MNDELPTTLIETTPFGATHHIWHNPRTGETFRGEPIESDIYDALPRWLFGRFFPDTTPVWPVRVWRFLRRRL